MLKDKVIILTGAAGGIGSGTAKMLAKNGAKLMLCDINQAGLEALQSEIQASGTQCEIFCGDVTNYEQMQEMARMTNERFGRIDVLVNNAGIMYCQGIAETSERMLKLIMMVHCYTSLMLCRKYVVPMKERGCGYILNISSLAECMSWPGIGMYGATKRFVKDYSRELRIECQKTGVSVTNAYFGAVDTPLIPLKDSLRKLARGLAVMITPEKAVDRALNATFRRRRGVMPGLLNHIFKPICIILPDCLLGWIYRKAKPYLMKV